MSKSSNHSDELNGNTPAKLRRLKIQESVLTSSVNKSLSTLQLDDEIVTNFQPMNEFKKYESSLDNTFIEIKNMLEDIKIATNARGNIEELDIDKVKRDVLDLEGKLRSFKTFLQTQIRTLKIRANEIHCELLINRREKGELKKIVRKSSTKHFSQIVPSPVRVLINSPFKCPEVQRFQEFVSSSKRYNDWNEYNHNVFIQIWNKYFHPGNGKDPNIEETSENTEHFHIFKEEVMEKISGLTSDDIMSHYKWYSEYVSLKNKQQKALQRWKENKQKIRKPRQEAKQVSRSNRSSESFNHTDKRLSIQQTTCKDSSENLANSSLDSNSKSKSSLKSNREYSASNTWSNKLKNGDQTDALSRLLKPTEQWRNKCQAQNDTMQLFFATTTDKRQLRIPSWRSGLQDL